MHRGHVDVLKLHTRGAVLGAAVNGDLEWDARARDVIDELHRWRIALYEAAAGHDCWHGLLLKAASCCHITTARAIEAGATDSNKDVPSYSTSTRPKRVNLWNW